jgi:hypothetical protein
MGIAVPLIFLNMLTPPCDCPLCVSLRRRESAVSGEYRKAFPDKQQIQIYRQPGIVGPEQLERLGQNLYQPAGQEMVAYAAF